MSATVIDTKPMSSSVEVVLGKSFGAPAGSGEIKTGRVTIAKRSHNFDADLRSGELSNFYFGMSPVWVFERFSVRGGWEVKQFMQTRPEVANALHQTEEALREHFPSETLQLEIYHDPEGEAEDEMAIYVLTPEEVDRASKQLDAFDEAFWLNHFEFEDFMSVNLKFH